MSPLRIALVLALTLLALATPVRADEMGLTVSRFRHCPAGETCDGATPTSAWNGDAESAARANRQWHSLIAQASFALAPPIMSPAKSLGARHFSLSFETGLTGISDSADYWIAGTYGDGMQPSNRFVQSLYNFSRLIVRKGLPYGFELGLTGGHAYHAELWAWGAEIEWSILEGFRHGPVAYLPEIAVRGAVHTVTGDSEFSLTIISADVIVSKEFVLGETLQLDPFFGASLLWTIADSEIVDITPEIPGTESTMIEAENAYVFPDVRTMRSRMSLGLQLRYKSFMLTGAAHMDMLPPSTVDSDFSPALPRQWTVSFGAGVRL